MFAFEKMRVQLTHPILTAKDKKYLRVSFGTLVKHTKFPAVIITETIMEWNERIKLPLYENQDYFFEIYNRHKFGYDDRELENIFSGKFQVVARLISRNTLDLYDYEDERIGFLKVNIKFMGNVYEPDSMPTQMNSYIEKSNISKNKQIQGQLSERKNREKMRGSQNQEHFEAHRRTQSHQTEEHSKVHQGMQSHQTQEHSKVHQRMQSHQTQEHSKVHQRMQSHQNEGNSKVHQKMQSHQNEGNSKVHQRMQSHQNEGNSKVHQKMQSHQNEGNSKVHQKMQSHQNEGNSKVHHSHQNEGNSKIHYRHQNEGNSKVHQKMQSHQNEGNSKIDLSKKQQQNDKTGRRSKMHKNSASKQLKKHAEQGKTLKVNSLVTRITRQKLQRGYVVIQIGDCKIKTEVVKDQSGKLVFIQPMEINYFKEQPEAKFTVFSVDKDNKQEIVGEGSLQLTPPKPPRKMNLKKDDQKTGIIVVESKIIDHRELGMISQMIDEHHALMQQRKGKASLSASPTKKIKHSRLQDFGIEPIEGGQYLNSELGSLSRYSKRGKQGVHGSFNKQKRFSAGQEEVSGTISYLRERNFEFRSFKTGKFYKGAGIGYGNKIDFSKQKQPNPGISNYKLPSIFDKY